jgi:hypothetical protein
MNRAKPTDLDAALATMSADGLREIVHEPMAARGRAAPRGPGGPREGRAFDEAA